MCDLYSLSAGSPVWRQLQPRAIRSTGESCKYKWSWCGLRCQARFRAWTRLVHTVWERGLGRKGADRGVDRDLNRWPATCWHTFCAVFFRPCNDIFHGLMLPSLPDRARTQMQRQCLGVNLRTRERIRVLRARVCRALVGKQKEMLGNCRQATAVHSDTELCR